MEKRRAALIDGWTDLIGANLLGFFLLNLPLTVHYGTRLRLHLIPSEMLVLGALMYPWFVFFPRRVASAGSVLSVGLLSFVNCLRMNSLGSPLLPSDIHFLFQPELLAAYSPVSVALVVSAFPIFAGWAVYQRASSSPQVAQTSRTRFLLVWLLALSWTSLLAFHPAWVTETLGITSLRAGKDWRLGESVTVTGLANALATGVSELGLKRPVGFSHLDSLEALGSLKNEPLAPAPATASRPLVVILLESFVDPSMYGLELSADPIPNLHALAERHQAYKVIVPAYGGGTATTSFELLSGVSLSELESLTHPFLDLIHQPTHSLAWTFRRNGYETIGLHNFVGHSWRRNQVWPFLGFKRTAFLEEMPGVEQNYRGFPVSDAPLIQRINKEIETADGPFFLYGVTVALHAPYFPRARSSSSIRVRQSAKELGIRRREKAQLEEYLNRMHQMDTELLPLIQLLESKKIPFIFFGDHHAYVAERLMKGKWGEDEHTAKHTTPLVVQRDLAKSMRLPGTFEMSCLANRLVSALQLKTSRIDELVFRKCEVGSETSDLRKNILYDLFHSRLGFEGGRP